MAAYAGQRDLAARLPVRAILGAISTPAPWRGRSTTRYMAQPSSSRAVGGASGALLVAWDASFSRARPLASLYGLHGIGTRIHIVRDAGAQPTEPLPSLRAARWARRAPDWMR